jgi:hypothetical protein
MRLMSLIRKRPISQHTLCNICILHTFYVQGDGSEMQQTQVLQQTRLMQCQRTPCVWCASQTRLLHFTHDKRACCDFSMRTTHKTQLLHSTCSKHNQHAKNAFHACEPQMQTQKLYCAHVFRTDKSNAPSGGGAPERKLNEINNTQHHA